MTSTQSRLRLSCFFVLILALTLVGCTHLQFTPTSSYSGTPTQTKETTTPDISSSDILIGDVASNQKPALLLEAQSDLEHLTDLTQYEIELVVDHEGHTFQGISQVNITNTEDIPLDRLYFRLLPNGQNSYGNGSLSVTQVRVDGTPVDTNLSLSDTILEVLLPRPLSVGEGNQLEFDFQGVVPVDFGGDEDPAGYGIYNFSDSVLTLSGWYPILAVYDEDGWNLDPVSPIGDSVYSDIALYSVEVIADSDLILATTGIEVDQQTTNGETRYHFVSGPVRDFFLIMSPDFQVRSTIVNGTQVNSYYLPGHKTGGEVALSVTADSLRVFNERFGVYPYTELDVVDAPMRLALGVEYPAIFLVASNLYDEPEEPSFVVSTAHEVAHQWWYNLVGNDVFDEPWLDEALTTYSSSLYYEDVIGQAAFRGLVGYWQGRYDELVQDGGDDLIIQELAYFENASNPRTYGSVVYSKGALFFMALRNEIGDEDFFRALRQYYQDNKYQIAKADDLLRAVEQVSGKSLEGFYQQWLYSAER